MEIPRAQLLAEELKVTSSQVAWCFVADYYDGPVEGLVYFRKKICRCCCFPEDIPEQMTYVIQDLSEEELKEALCDKEKFERMVGTHWSYDENGNPLPASGATPESTKRYYEEQGELKHSTPWDREIIAWFDCSA